MVKLATLKSLAYICINNKSIVSNLKIKIMTTERMNATINERINQLIEAGAQKELLQQGLTEAEIKEELYAAAICTLLGL